MAWSHRIAEIQGRPAQFLIDDRFRTVEPIRELPRLAWFGVYCQPDPGSSFWHPDESDQLDAIEDTMIELWNQMGHGFAVYALRIATYGIREYYVYLGSNADFAQVLARVQAKYPEYRIEFEESQDPAWNRYISCLPIT